MVNSAEKRYSWAAAEEKALEELLSTLTDESRHVVESHHALRPAIRDTLKRWGRVHAVYREISKPQRRRKALEALREAQRVVNSLWPLFEKDGRFPDLADKSGLYRYTGTTGDIIHFIKELKPEGGPTPQLPIAGCAEELNFWFREYTGGRAHWRTIGEIIKYWFKEDAPYDVKDLVERRLPKWWKQFKERTRVGEKPLERFWEVKKRRDQKKRKLIQTLYELLHQSFKLLEKKLRQHGSNRRRKSPEEKRLKSQIQKAREELNEFNAQVKRDNQKNLECERAYQLMRFKRTSRKKESEEKRQATVKSKSREEKENPNVPRA